MVSTTPAAKSIDWVTDPKTGPSEKAGDGKLLGPATAERSGATRAPKANANAVTTSHAVTLTSVPETATATAATPTKLPRQEAQPT